MAVILNGKKIIDANSQWVYCTLTVDGADCKYVTIQPWNNDTTAVITVDNDLTTYLNNKEEQLEFEILSTMYPGANYSESAGETNHAKIIQWIDDGCTNPAVYDGTTLVTAEVVIDKVSYPDTHGMPHPEKQETVDRGQMSDDTIALLNDSTDVADLKIFLQAVFKTV